MTVGRGTVLLAALVALATPAASWTSALAEYDIYQCPPLFCPLQGQCELQRSAVNGCEICECAEDPCQGTTCPQGQSCSRGSSFARSLNLPSCLPDLMLRLLPTAGETYFPTPATTTTTTTTTTPAPPVQQVFNCPKEFISGDSNSCPIPCSGESACKQVYQFSLCCLVDTPVVNQPVTNPVNNNPNLNVNSATNPTQQPRSDTSADRCSMPMKMGPCRAGFKRYAYNNETMKCEMFHFGGCDPNANNFETLEQCQLVCERLGSSTVEQDDSSSDSDESDPCEQPVSPGVCRAMFQRYSYDKGSNSCKEFYFGGCGANKNNFLTKEDCQKRCVKQ